MKGYANGDNWPIAWMHDDSQLTAFCDGKGFSEKDPDLSLGFAWVYGDPPKWMSPDGKTMWLLYSGLDCDLYSFCVKEAVLEVVQNQ